MRASVLSEMEARYLRKKVNFSLSFFVVIVVVSLLLFVMSFSTATILSDSDRLFFCYSFFSLSFVLNISFFFTLSICLFRSYFVSFSIRCSHFVHSLFDSTHRRL